MKGFFRAAAAVAAMLVLASCRSSDGGLSVMERIQKQLNEMESYRCTAQLTRISNKGENVYDIKQYYKSSGEYRLEMTGPEGVAGNYTVYNGETVCQYNPRVSGRVIKDVPASQMRNELFLGQFVKNYMNSEEVAVETAAVNLNRCTVLEAVIPGGFQYTATEKLWVDEETILPVKLVIYDNEGGERYILEYKDFEFNVELDDKLFEIPEN